MTVAMITGATSGIGREFAGQLAAGGHDLVIVARDTDRLSAVAGEIGGATGVRVEVLAADLADRAALERVAARVAATERPVEVLVNNAGYGLGRAFLDNDVAAEEAMFEVLTRAVLVLSHAAGRAMRERGSGTIINVSSVAGWIAGGTYSAAKSWVTTFTEGLAGDLAGTGVHVTALCPGFVRTEFQQRAGHDATKIPGPLWLEAGPLVESCLRDAERGRVVSVPSLRYKVLGTGARLAPRALVRSGGFVSRHRR
jgi:hypothetical protein